MGSITLNGLPEATNGGRSYLYADLHLDLEDNYNINDNLFQKSEINDFKIDYDLNAVKNSLYNLFTTTPGEKILNPEYGLDLRQYIFEPATIEVAKEIQRKIYGQVRRFEPRVKITNVYITILEDVNEFDINVYYSITTLNIHNMTIFGTLGRTGYIYKTQ